MLYIKFNIQDNSKYPDFQTLYTHMVNMREPGFEYVDNSPEIDWDTKKTQEEVDAAVKELSDYLDEKPEVHRYNELIPDYVTLFLEQFLKADNEKLASLGIQDIGSIFNYLEYGFEVDMDALEKINEQEGIVTFSTGNYPFGGIERFLITMKAYDLVPTECFNGFEICELNWTSKFDYETAAFPERTKEYIQSYKTSKEANNLENITITTPSKLKQLYAYFFK
ncbi:hypothetical protein [Ulvibacter litoralis]|uniref:Uncharacterized protein n=1 Tax=Ulvibacter litoralis TaxID=227084 RepID=A0A1G7CKB4_9FLAO|nr:hypothetical protein [Ulvibacter litoralis]GHC47015.1 hypothetical protein GCM10008083_07640 [Ulvibacter litoralis]SDE39834.1 hypothetical protein SAMN05421855_101433 [Ulvibacter litoralis]